ncbi:MAG: ferrous iron transport protein B [Myxococcales bacterium]|nr:ferrous iron transport protein B [Myxococcales bacterium]
MSDKPLVYLVGNPNAGKTTLFNRLAGVRARTGNYPGVTVERRTAAWRAGPHAAELVDLPGTYSLSARSPEEQIAVDALLRDAPAVVVVVLDGTSLERSLYLALQVCETGLPTVVALNMMDEVRASGMDVDVDVLAARLGADVVPVVASRSEGLDALTAAVAARLDEQRLEEERATDTPTDAPTDAPTDVPTDAPTDAPTDTPTDAPTDDRDQAALPSAGEPPAGRPAPPAPVLGAEAEADVEAVARVAADVLKAPPRLARAWALWALLSLDRDDELHDVPAALRAIAQARHEAADAAGRDLDLELVAARYALLDQLISDAVRPGPPKPRLTDRIDAVLVHPVAGLVAFAAVMFVVFESLFRWSEPAIGLIEEGIAASQGWLRGVMTEGPFRDLLTDGVVAGVGNVLVFVPQIALLFLLISFLEDSGYLARVAFVIDRVMKSVGLHGKAFVPLLSGFACAVPAVLATRTIASRKDRLVTMMALPLMSCSARLPIYVLVTATIFPADTRVGVFSVGAVVLFSMYSLSVAATLGAAAVLRRTAVRGPRPTMVLELPPYRLPVLRNLVGTTWDRVKTFLVDAGTIILALTIVLWALLSFPKSADVGARYEAERAAATAALEGEALDERLAALDAAEAGEQLEHSIAGRLGKGIEPAIEPLGMDWRMGVGVLGAFAAREVFISTLGVVFGIGEADEESSPLREQLRDATRRDGSKLMTPLSGVALMVFFVLACQCMSTIAVVRRESGSWKWPALMFGYMTALAYVVTLIVYQTGLALGWGLG